MHSRNYDLALEKLRKILVDPEMKQEIREVIQNRDVVIAHYRPVFSLENIPKLSEEEFRSFLYFENNRHWSSLFRHVGTLCDDMTTLRETLALLVDPAKPLADRFDEAVGRVRGLGKALATAILLVSSPDTYGIWNNTSEKAMKGLGVWQDFVRGRTPGHQYEKLNQLLIRIASDLNIDLWTLDALMWGAIPEDEEEMAVKLQPILEPHQAQNLFLNEIQHPDLKARLARLTSAPLDTVIREAGVVFEHHLRNKVDSNSTKHGVDLIDDALKPGGALVFSSQPGEQQGIQFLFRGAMQFIRNPPMHKIIDYPESMARQFLRLIDALMIILDEAALAGEITTDEIRFMLKRKPIPRNQMELYRVIYHASDSGIAYKDLAAALKISPQQLSGVLGSLGSRINNTDGLEDKGGTLLVINIKELPNGEWSYHIRPILKKALEEERLV